jgi:hypothetical protein
LIGLVAGCVAVRVFWFAGNALLSRLSSKPVLMTLIGASRDAATSPQRVGGCSARSRGRITSSGE